MSTIIDIIVLHYIILMYCYTMIMTVIISSSMLWIIFAGRSQISFRTQQANSEMRQVTVGFHLADFPEDVCQLIMPSEFLNPSAVPCKFLRTVCLTRSKALITMGGLHLHSPHSLCFHFQVFISASLHLHRFISWSFGTVTSIVRHFIPQDLLISSCMVHWP